MAIQVFSRFNSLSVCGFFLPCAAGWSSDIIAGLERVYLLRDEHVFAAVNLSVGEGLFSSTCDEEQPYKPAIDNLRSVGIASVAASGNDGSKTSISAPACTSSAVSVGSTSDDGHRLELLELYIVPVAVRPGGPDPSSMPGEVTPRTTARRWRRHVAGAFAILKKAAPAATVTDPLVALQQTGLPIADMRPGERRPSRGSAARGLPCWSRNAVPRGVTPEQGAPGEQLTVSVAAANFQTGASSASALAPPSPRQPSSRPARRRHGRGGGRGGARQAQRDGHQPGRPDAASVQRIYGRAAAAADHARLPGQAARPGRQSKRAAPADGALDGTFTLEARERRRQPHPHPARAPPHQRKPAAGTPSPPPPGGRSAPQRARRSAPQHQQRQRQLRHSTKAKPSTCSPATPAQATASPPAANLPTHRHLQADGTSTTTQTTSPPATHNHHGGPSTATPRETLSVSVSRSQLPDGGQLSFGAGTNVTRITVVPAQPDGATSCRRRGDARQAQRDGQQPAAARRGVTARIYGRAAAAAVDVAPTRASCATGSAKQAGSPPTAPPTPPSPSTLGSGAGNRTLTQLELRRTDNAGGWDTVPTTPGWALGAATGSTQRSSTPATAASPSHSTKAKPSTCSPATAQATASSPAAQPSASPPPSATAPQPPHKQPSPPGHPHRRHRRSRSPTWASCATGSAETPVRSPPCQAPPTAPSP